jgi:hypothetical protein
MLNNTNYCKTNKKSKTELGTGEGWRYRGRLRDFIVVGI